VRVAAELPGAELEDAGAEDVAEVEREDEDEACDEEDWEIADERDDEMDDRTDETDDEAELAADDADDATEDADDSEEVLVEEAEVEELSFKQALLEPSLTSKGAALLVAPVLSRI
jgi:hypothetical protein